MGWWLMARIVFTGGGTAGHVIPAIALFDELINMQYELFYIGSKTGIEKDLIASEGVPYFPISTGKLRRYFDLENFIDPFRIIKGILEARRALKKISPDLVFSKGGFVSVPVIFAAYLLKIPVILHESDFSPGLSNKMVLRFADKILVTFPETKKYLPEEKTILSGTPIRSNIFSGDRERAKKQLRFDEKPVVLIMGGSSGSEIINETLRTNISHLLGKFNIIHLCGKGNLDSELAKVNGYQQFEFVTEELPDFFALADLVISRAGANAIHEVLALRIPNILIPLSMSASRGDQLLNAESFENNGFSRVLTEDNLTPESLAMAVEETLINKEEYITAMKMSKQRNSNRIIIEEINRFLIR